MTPPLHDLDLLKDLRQRSPQALAALFSSAVLRQKAERWSPPAPVADAHLAAQILRAVDGDISVLGIQWKPEPSPLHLKPDDGSDPWRGMLSVLRTCDDAEDGILIFNALAKTIEGQERQRGGDLLDAALEHPKWRDLAIQAHPHLFRVASNSHAWDNAFRVMATQPLSETDDEFESTLRTLQLLTSLGIKPLKDHFGQNILMTAIPHRHKGGFQALVTQFPLLVNEVNKKGDTLLHLTTHHRHMDKIEILIKAGVNPFVSNNAGITPMMFSSRAGHVDSVKTFLRMGLIKTAEQAQELINCTEKIEVQALLQTHQAMLAMDGALRVKSCELAPL